MSMQLWIYDYLQSTSLIVCDDGAGRRGCWQKSVTIINSLCSRRIVCWLLVYIYLNQSSYSEKTTTLEMIKIRSGEISGLRHHYSSYFLTFIEFSPKSLIEKFEREII
jgi:hypothetical protein